jgi:hypothetical protein
MGTLTTLPALAWFAFADQSKDSESPWQMRIEIDHPEE